MPIHDLNFYIFGLHALIGCVIIAVIIVFYSFKVEKVEGVSNSFFQAYLILGIVAWLGNILRDARILEVELAWSASGYVIVSAILLFSVYEYVRKLKVALITIIIHSIFIGYFLFSSEYSSLFLSFSLYGLVFYSIIFYGLTIRALKTKNVGYAFVAFGALIVSISSLLQIYIVLDSQDYEIAYGLVLMHSAIAFIMIGIGFISILLFSKQKQLTALALNDPLTGLLNRRGMDVTIPVTINSAKRFDKCLSAIAIDIDYFKKINDTYGHDGGDAVLVEIGNLLSSHARSIDICCRFGGEEFLIVLPDTEVANAIQAAERIRQAVSMLEIDYNKQKIRLTSSFGVATHCGVIDVDYLLKDADKALYRAKETGRNKVCHASDLENSSENQTTT